MEHVVNQSMKAPCKHRTGHKTKHIYIQEQAQYINSLI